MIRKQNLDPFGVEYSGVSLEALPSLKEELIQSVWDHGFVVLKRLPTHWQVIHQVALLFGNLADASPVDHPECPFIGQITGQIYENGKAKGRMGGKAAIEWHSDNCATKKLRPIIMFQGIEKVEGGYQEYLSNDLVYATLPVEIQQELQRAEGLFYFNHEVFQNDLLDLIAEHENWKKLVVIKPNGKQGFFYPWLFCKEIRGTSDNNYIFNFLKDRFQNFSKIYRHKWDLGDLFITESLSTQHRRPPTENAKERLLYRVNCGNEYVFEDSNGKT